MTRAPDAIVRAAMTVDDELDDIKRAQIWTRLEARLAPAPRPRAWWRLVAPTGALALAALAVVLVLAPGRRVADRDASLAAPAGTTLSTPLGPYARASLVGPARLELVTVGETTVARLHAGTLLAEFTGGPGRSLRVETPAFAVIVVGTLFAIDVPEPGPPCVSVAHGRVRVEPRGSIAPVFVSTGERWCDGDRAPGPIAPDTADALARHGSPQQPIVTPLPVPPPAPAPIARVEHTPPTKVIVAAAPVPVPVPVRDPVPVPVAAPAAASAPATDPVPTPPPPPKPAPVAQPAPAPAPPTADTLFAAAETALARGNDSAAAHALDELIATFPTSPVVDQALYERAQLAYRHHAYQQAQAALAGLARIASTPLAEPGAYLACRIAVETHDSSAHPCIVGYRHAYPQSPHDLDLLGWLIEEAASDGGCARAAPLLRELNAAHATSKLAHAWHERCPEPK